MQTNGPLAHYNSILNIEPPAYVGNLAGLFFYRHINIKQSWGL